MASAHDKVSHMIYTDKINSALAPAEMHFWNQFLRSKVGVAGSGLIAATDWSKLAQKWPQLSANVFCLDHREIRC